MNPEKGENQEPVKSVIPLWDDLLALSGGKSRDPVFLDKISKLKKRPSRFFLQVGKLLAAKISKDPSIRKFVDSSFEEIVDIIAAQVAENSDLRQSAICNSEFVPFLQKYRETSKRRFQQQPCTAKTTLARVGMALKHCALHSPILVLGDDDMVGVELGRAGFTDVTVVDIDSDILDVVRSLSRTEQLQIKTLRHDLSKSVPKSFVRDYRFVFLDPDYSIPGAKIFLGAAQEFTNTSQDSCFFLSIHLMSLLKSGLSQFESMTREIGLEACEFYPSFNSYPIPPGVKGLIGLVNCTITSSRVLRSEGIFPYFVSDALVLKPNKELTEARSQRFMGKNETFIV